MAAAFDPVAFIERHGVVLAAARGPVPSLAEAVAGEPIRGSWWGHPAGQAIFQALCRVDESPDVLSFRLVQGKITLVHRRLWPALVRLAEVIGHPSLGTILQEHTASGAHRNVTVPFPEWVPPHAARAAGRLTEEAARAQLGEWVSTARAVKPGRPRR